VGRLAVQQEQWETALIFLAPARGAEASAIAAEALFWSGEVYLHQQRWELAQQVYQELLDRYPGEFHWTALTRLRLGTIYEQQQDWEQALRAYHTLLETTTETEVVATARRRIMAIEAGRTTPQRVPTTPSEG
jgi:TolA-binding protein